MLPLLLFLDSPALLHTHTLIAQTKYTDLQPPAQYTQSPSAEDAHAHVHARVCAGAPSYHSNACLLFLASLSLSIPCPLSLVNYTETAGLSSLIWKDTTPWRADPVTLLLIPKSSTHRLVDNQKLHTEDADPKKKKPIRLFVCAHKYI